MGLARLIGITGLASVLAACAVAAPLTLESVGSVGGKTPTISLSISSKSTTPPRAKFGDALAKAFTDNAALLDDKGGLLADFALSIGAASDGVLRGDAKSAEVENNPDWIAPPRKSGRFDKCDAKRMRGTLVLLDRETSETVYRGTADQIDCEFGDGDITNMAHALVKDALGFAHNATAN